MSAARGFDAAHLADLVVVSDAELGRLRQALRVTLTVMVAAALLHRLAGSQGQPTSVALVGINVAVMGVAVVNDPTPRAQRLTTLLVPFAAGLALLVGALVQGNPLLRDLLFVALAFVAVLARRVGPRGFALGMIAFLAYFSALFFHADLARLPLMLTSVLLASALAYAARFWVVRERPDTRLRLRLMALRRTVAVALHHLARLVALGHEAPRRVQALRRTLAALNESALALDDLLDRLDPADGSALREQVFALELAVEEVAAATAPVFTLARPSRDLVAAALSAVRLAVRAGDPASARRAARALAALSQARDDAEELAPIEAGLRALLAALQIDLPRVRLAPPPAARPAARAAPTWSWSLRQAAQVTLAVALALVLGRLADGRAYWAVMAAFMVFSRATTRGALLVRAWQRALGTIVGVLIGLLIAYAVHGRPHLELGVLFACVFVAYYTQQVAHTWMIAAITTLIAVLYGLLGVFSPELLYLRTLETLIGVGVGAGVAMLVFPVSTRATIRGHMVDALRLLADELARAFAPGRDHGERLDAARALDRKLRDVRSEVEGAAGGLRLRPSQDTARLFLRFAAVFFHARPLITHEPRALAPADRERAQALAERLADHARALADALAGQRPDLPPAPVVDASAPCPALRGLDRLARAQRALARAVTETDTPRGSA